MINLLTPMFDAIDALRRAQGQGLRVFGFGPQECRYEIVASTPLWRLRRYAGEGAGPNVLIVAAPIKYPYIWDLSPSASAVRLCLQEGLRLHLLEWVPPMPGGTIGGLAEYAEDAIWGAVAAVGADEPAARPVLIGHSLGGTLAAIFAGLHPECLAAVVLLSAPLCLPEGVSGYRDTLAAAAPRWLAGLDIIPGSLLSQLSAVASPTTFFWSRLVDAAASAGDRRALEIRSRIEHWALEEVPISGKLANEILLRLYRENQLCTGELDIRGRKIDPSRLRLPILAVANSQDDVSPPATVRPFLEATAGKANRLIEYPGETGVVLQHLGILVGKEALARYWPEIVAWMKTHG